MTGRTENEYTLLSVRNSLWLEGVRVGIAVLGGVVVKINSGAQLKGWIKNTARERKVDPLASSDFVSR